MLRDKGITIQLYETVQTGTDDFGAPIYEEIPKDVENVLVGNPASDGVLSTLNLTGRRAVYFLGIPKGDTNDWVDKKVGFFGELFQTTETPIQGIEELVPLDWNKLVKVERYGNENQHQL